MVFVNMVKPIVIYRNIVVCNVDTGKRLYYFNLFSRKTRNNSPLIGWKSSISI